MDYDIKANITTILTFFLMPIFASLGVDAVTGNAMIGALAVLVFYVLMYLNERYLSKIFTKDGYDVVKDSNICECDKEEPVVSKDSDEEPVVSEDSVIKSTDDEVDGA